MITYTAIYILHAQCDFLFSFYYWHLLLKNSIYNYLFRLYAIGCYLFVAKHHFNDCWVIKQLSISMEIFKI